jgi:hypothetical protein
MDSLIIAGRQFRSRLIVGTGKYKSFQETARALEASGADMVTVAVRRVNLDRSKESLLDYMDPKNRGRERPEPVLLPARTRYARQRASRQEVRIDVSAQGASAEGASGRSQSC